MNSSPPVTLGFAEDAATDAALSAAIREATLRNTTLTIIHQLVGDEVPERYGHYGRIVDRRRRAVSRIARKIIEVAPLFDRFDIRVVTSPIARELLAASRVASLVVIGVTTRHAALAAVLDTVPHELVRYAQSPVLLVPSQSQEWSGASIVCGVDRSDSSAAALCWAAEEAERRGVIVHAVEILSKKPSDPLDASDPDSLQSWARTHVPQSTATVVCSTELAHPSHRLLEIASEAHGILVVGSHTRAGRWTPSVARVVTAQLEVPVVVVPSGAKSPILAATLRLERRSPTARLGASS